MCKIPYFALTISSTCAKNTRFPIDQANTLDISFFQKLEILVYLYVKKSQLIYNHIIFNIIFNVTRRGNFQISR